MKKTTHRLFTMYIFLVIWIILFKLAISIDQLPQFRSINLIPFYYPNKTTYQIREVLDNLIIFIPFGLYLKLSQYIFCIGASDITDLITNTTGALVGVGIYFLLKKIFKDKTNKIILTLASIVTFLFVSLIMIILINN